MDYKYPRCGRSPITYPTVPISKLPSGVRPHEEAFVSNPELFEDVLVKVMLALALMHQTGNR